MSEYSYLKIGTFCIWDIRNDVDPIIMQLFTEHENRRSFVINDAGKPDERSSYYQVSVKILKQRLDIMGITIAESIKAMELGKKKLMELIDLSIEDEIAEKVPLTY